MDGKKIIYMLIPLVVLFILGIAYYGPTGFFLRLELGVKYALDVAPEVNRGTEELTAREISLAPRAGREAAALKENLQEMMKSKKKNCFQKFGGFKDDLGESEESSASFAFTYNPPTKQGEEGSTTVQVNVFKAQQYKSFTIPGMRPCIMAGPGGITERFFDDCLDNDCPNPAGDYGTLVDEVEIFYSEENFNGNKISVKRSNPPWDPEHVNDDSDNYKSDGILYKGADNRVCFFPSNIQFNHDEDGIDDTYLSGTVNPESLANKIRLREVPVCSDAPGFEAVILHADDDYSTGLSSGKLDCASWRAESELTLKSVSKLEQVGTFNGIGSPHCGEMVKLNIGDNLPVEGCWALIEEERNTPSCGWVEIAPGEVIPSLGSSGTLLYPHRAPRYRELGAMCLLNNFRWTNNENNDLLCAGNKWVQCGDSFLVKDGQTVTEKKLGVGVKDSFSQGHLVEFTCKKEGESFTWTRESTLAQPWFNYEGIELYADNDNDYDDNPDECETGLGFVNFACDSRGAMGKSENRAEQQGIFSCPSQDKDCNTEFTSWQSGEVSPEGCTLWLSEEDNFNQCGYATVPHGTNVTPWAAKFKFNTFNPINLVGNTNAKCLTKNQWAVPESRSTESLICGADSYWYRCEPRKFGSCLPGKINGAEFCCDWERGMYLFKQK